MVWKEVRVEGGLRFGWLGRILVALLVVGSFVPVVLILYFMFFDMNNRWVYRSDLWSQLGESVNIWLRVMNVIISVLMLLGVAVRAAGSVSGERDRDTLVSLMTTTLTTQEIWWAKWLGSLLSVRMFLWWLGAVWAVGLVTGAVAVPAVVLELFAWLAPAAFVAAVGLYCSAACRTTLRATTWALLATLFAGGFHWLCTGMCFYAPLAIVGEAGGLDLTWTMEFELGMTPPVVFGWLPYRELNDLKFGSDNRFPGLVVLGLFLWCVATAVVGHLAHERFRQLTHRDTGDRGPAPRVTPAPGGK
jgi:hypothetical protein